MGGGGLQFTYKYRYSYIFVFLVIQSDDEISSQIYDVFDMPVKYLWDSKL